MEFLDGLPLQASVAAETTENLLTETQQFFR